MCGRLVVIACFILSIGLTSGCKKPFFRKSTHFESGWSFNDTLSFCFDIPDTTARYDFFVLLDQDDQFQYSNLWTFIKIVDEKGHYEIDTVSCPLASPDGTWLGTSFSGDIHNRIMFKHNTGFPAAGRYCVALQQGMRDTSLQHVKAAGFELKIAGH